jgi:hypothetical protein
MRVNLTELLRLKHSPKTSGTADAGYLLTRDTTKEEIEFRVKMVPKATRNITLQITTRGKGMPKPILL